MSLLIDTAQTKVKPAESQIGAEDMNMGQASAFPSSNQKELRGACENCNIAKMVSLLFPVTTNYLLSYPLPFYCHYTHRRLALLWRMTDIVKYI